jgi:hypothetical protein
MSLRHVFNIFQKPQFDETIQKIENRSYYPYLKSFNNNDAIEITINQSDSWQLMYDSALIIEGKLIKKTGTGSVTLINNAGAFLFNTIEYYLNGKEVETVRDPGIVSTIRGYLCYNSHDSKHLDIAGWNFPNHPIVNADGSFVLRIPLKHLFSIFVDYQVASFGKQTVRLVRAKNDNDCMLVSEVGNAPEVATTGELTVNNVYLKVNIITPNDMLKVDLYKAIKADKPILIPFRKWEYHELPQLTQGAVKEIWGVKISTSVESPRYVIVAFQTNRRDNDKKDLSYFDNIDISDIHTHYVKWGVLSYRENEI